MIGGLGDGHMGGAKPKQRGVRDSARRITMLELSQRASVDQ